MAVVIRHNNFDDERPPKEFGVRWTFAPIDPENCLTRKGDSVGMTVNTTPADANHAHHDSDFSSYLPWSGMERYYMNANGDIMAKVSETTLETIDAGAWNDATMRVVVRVPYFWYKVVPQDPDPATCNYTDYYISPYPLDGYSIHNAFIRYDYTNTTSRITDIYVGAYEMETTSGLMSVSGVAPKTNYGRDDFRTSLSTYAAAGYKLLDWPTYNALQWLYLIEYASLDSQTPSGSGARGGVGAGATSESVLTTGWTGVSTVTAGGYTNRDLGNDSGWVAASASVKAMSYRGIENLWGNTWTLLDGANISATTSPGGGGYVWITKGTPADQVAAAFADPYWKTAFTVPVSGWLLNPYLSLQYTLLGDDLIFGGVKWDTTSAAGSDSTYMCDYLIAPANTTNPHVIAIGGCVDMDLPAAHTPTAVGIWAMDCSLEYTTHGTMPTGSRVMQVPLDIDWWKI